MLTLTYPGSWEELAPGASVVVRHVEAFRSRLKRATGRPVMGIWKREFQARGAPHLHILLPLPTAIGDTPIQEWVSRAWFEVVESNDDRHLAAGTGIDWAEGMRAVDPVRVARYFSAHAVANGGSKAHQNLPPQLWLDSGDVGRFWGYWGLRPILEQVPLQGQDFIEIRRVLRGLDRSRGRTRRVRVPRVSRSTGQVRHRYVRRRAVLSTLSTGGRTGASVFTVDGPAVAEVLTRVVRAESVPGRLDPGRLP